MQGVLPVTVWACGSIKWKGVSLGGLRVGCLCGWRDKLPGRGKWIDDSLWQL